MPALLSISMTTSNFHHIQQMYDSTGLSLYSVFTYYNGPVMFPWKSVIQLNVSSKRPRYLQISDQMIKEITSGRLKPGQKIPGSRAMANLMAINRKTVIQAYDELIAQGWLQVRSSSGTYISQDLPLPRHVSLNASDLVIKHVSSPPVHSFDFIPSYNELSRGTLQVDGGCPDPRLAPMDWIYRECRSIVGATYGHRLLKYSDTKGDVMLRNALASYLSESRGMNLESDQLLITRGSQMGIFLAVQGLTKPGDLVVVGVSSYDAADWVIEYHGCEIVRKTVDEKGLNIDELAELCKSQPVKLVYITPHHHFPTTVTLSNSRRIQLLELAIRYNFIILEDDYDYDFHYKSAPILPLASLNHGGHVVYIGSLSKVFAPNVRVGYMAGAPKIIDQLSRIRRIIDRQGDIVMERVMAEAIRSGELLRHLKKSVRIYEKRRDHFAQLLSSQLANSIQFDLPEGGMAIWAKFRGVSLPQLKPVLATVGLSLDLDKDLAAHFNALRLGFASLNEVEQERAVDLLRKALMLHAS